MRARTAADVMTREVLAVEETTSLTELARFLVDHEITGAVVRDAAGRAIGVVSLADVAGAAALAGEAPATAAARAGFYAPSWEASFDEYDLETIHIEAGELTVGDVMTRQLIAVPPTAPVSEVAQRMLDSHVHRVLVRDDGEVVGVVSSSDLLALLAESGGAG